MSETTDLISEYEKARLERIMAKVLKTSNLPIRQFTRTQLGGPEEWNVMLKKLRVNLGTGFLHILIGSRGTGKTQMAVELARPNLADSRYTTAMGFFVTVRGAFKPDCSKTEEEIITDFGSVKFLIIDEIHDRSESPWENRLLTHLIDRRYAAMLDTLLIGNMNPEAIGDSLGASIVSRLNETGGILACRWPSFR